MHRSLIVCLIALAVGVATRGPETTLPVRVVSDDGAADGPSAAQPVPSSGNVIAAGSFTLALPYENATVTGPAFDVSGTVGAGIHHVHFTVLRGNFTAGSADLEIIRAGAFATSVRLGGIPVVGRARLVVTTETALGTVVLIARDIWICATCG
jgi:hypothetical protein